MTTNKGFSFIELGCALALSGLLLSMTVPAFYKTLMRAERRMVLERVRTAVALTKQEAFASNTTAILCGTYNQKTCHPHQDWSRGFLLVLKPSQNDTFPLPKLIRYFPGTHYGTLVFSQFGIHLKIGPDGHNNSNGTFTYCPLNGNRIDADGLVINKASRIYRLSKRNIHGILLTQVGTPQEMPLHCR